MAFDAIKDAQDVIDCSAAFLEKNETEDCLIAYEKLLKEYWEEEGERILNAAGQVH